MLKIQLVTYLWYDSFLISPFICINLYTFEVYVLKISALKLQKIIKLLIPKHATLISKHPVYVSIHFLLVLWFYKAIFCKKELKSILSNKEVAVALIKTSKLNGINTPWVYVVSECFYVNML